MRILDVDMDSEFGYGFGGWNVDLNFDRSRLNRWYVDWTGWSRLFGHYGENGGNDRVHVLWNSANSQTPSCGYSIDYSSQIR